jgi:hypothetical protein
MAAKNSKKAPAQAAAAPAEEPKQSRPQVQAASFDSFSGEEVSVPDIDGWYSPEAGEAGWVGRIVASFRMKDSFNEGKTRDVVVVRLFSNCSSAVDSDGEPVILEPGNTMAVSIKAKLLDILDYVEKRGTIAVKAIEKRPLAKGRSMWTFSIKGQQGMRVPRRQETTSSVQDLAGAEPWD